MKKLTYVFIIAGCLLIVFLIAWFYLPVDLRYYKEVKAGNEFSQNLKDYQQITDSLPGENDWEILKKLNPSDPYDEVSPEFRKLGENNFELIYVKGFDPPYLRYNSIQDEWSYK